MSLCRKSSTGIVPLFPVLVARLLYGPTDLLQEDLPTVKARLRVVATHDFCCSYPPSPISYGSLPGGEGLRNTVDALREQGPILRATRARNRRRRLSRYELGHRSGRPYTKLPAVGAW
jgi:hypothetical protein